VGLGRVGPNFYLRKNLVKKGPIYEINGVRAWPSTAYADARLTGKHVP
jgi:hypothetical protein